MTLVHHDHKLPIHLDPGREEEARIKAGVQPLMVKELMSDSAGQYWFKSVSFWIASSFIIGSCLFTIGGVSSMIDPLVLKATDCPLDYDVLRVHEGDPGCEGGLPTWKSTGLVTYTYFAGGTYFTMGAYLGWFNVINVGVLDDGVIGVGEIKYWGGPGCGHSSAAYWGALFYFIGALLFQLAVLVPLVTSHPPPMGVALFEWLPQSLGGACFTAAALIEWNHNRHADWSTNVWWLCVTYLIGSMLFWVAATAGLYKSLVPMDLRSEEIVAVWLVDFPYAIGSMFFWVGAWVQMQMWKGEQYGLGMMSELNLALAEKLQRKAWRWQDRLQLQIATWYATLVVLNVCIAHAWTFSEVGAFEIAARGSGLMTASDVFSVGASLLASHAILLLGTVLHQTPHAGPPYALLVVLLRIVSFLFLVAELLRTVQMLRDT